MDFVNSAYEDYCSRFHDNLNLGENISLKKIEERENCIRYLQTLKTNLDTLTNKLTQKLTNMITIHNSEIENIAKLINNIRAGASGVYIASNEIRTESNFPKINCWATPSDHIRVKGRKASMIQKNNNSDLPVMQQLSSLPLSIIPSTDSVYLSKVFVSANCYLDAVKVATMDDVKSDGYLYYVDSNEHFAFKINGNLMHGNIGKIYTQNEKTPTRIHECKFVPKLSHPNGPYISGKNDCSYYHDPAVYPGSRDVRNFIASSFLYASANSPYYNKARSRRFGNIESLDIDYNTIDRANANRFIDQAMNDFLSALLLKNLPATTT